MSTGFVRMAGTRSFAEAVRPAHPLGTTHSVVARRVQQPRRIGALQRWRPRRPITPTYCAGTARPPRTAHA
uniref:Uncharacterized protein n=1 Tax=Ralstonia solanacearum TaxID=305 RepID=A0A809DXQ8_RALSL